MSHQMDVLIIGGGMITTDLLLPAVYRMQREGTVGSIDICALNSTPLISLGGDATLTESFPGQTFTPHPSFDEPEENTFPDLYRKVLAQRKPRQAVVVALPDQLHFATVREALMSDQHVLCVKPLVLTYDEAHEIRELAFERGLFVGIEYHKRFDRRALVARREYRQQKFGEFVMGEARLLEPYFYRFSNFQNWFTADKTDPFVYVGCHYVDLVWFITGLKPTAISVEGVKRAFPNGNEGYLWASGRVRYENGALLNVATGLGYPDDAAGSNDQGLVLYCEGDSRSGMIYHDDHYRGVAYSYLEGSGPGGSRYNYVNPDFIRYVPREGTGYEPVGYGIESVTANIMAMHRIEDATRSLAGDEAIAMRRKLIREVDERGIIATPANSYINELVDEAARLSILSGGDSVEILYGDHPRVKPKY